MLRQGKAKHHPPEFFKENSHQYPQGLKKEDTGGGAVRELQGASAKSNEEKVEEATLSCKAKVKAWKLI